MIKAQDGTKLPTAPKAEDRYANSIRLYEGHPRFKYDVRYLDGQTTGVVLDTPYTTIPANITLQVIGNDTIYRETPDQKRFSLRGFPVTRTATNTDSNRQEFETMRRRFNTAWGIAKHEEGNKIKLSPATPYDRGLNKPNTINSVPEINVKGIDRRWRFDTRESNHGNGYKVKSLTFFDYYDGGNRYLGDLAPIRGGRTIYMSPKGNDTLYWNLPSTWIEFRDGYMPVGGNEPGAKTNFFKSLKRPLVKNQEGGSLKRIPFNLDHKITYKTPEFVPTYNKTVPEVNVISAKLPGIEVTAPDLSKTLRFPYGGINVVSKSINGGLDRKQRTFVNPFEGHDLVASKLEGGTVLPTAQKAEIRYQNGVRDSVAYLGVPGKDESYFGESIRRVTTPDNAKIQLQVLFRHYPNNNDTIYTEVPEHKERLLFLPPVNIKSRKAFNYIKGPEYEILKRRFNTAWNLAK